MEKQVIPPDLEEAKRNFKGKVKIIPPESNPEAIGFEENADYYWKPIDPGLWMLYYYKKEYRKHTG